MDRFAVPSDFKFIGEPISGVVSGYASLFGVRDAHGDVVLPGAFGASLAARRAEGRALPPMRVQHGAALGASPLPVGKWSEVVETAAGLHVTGKLSGLDTDQGRQILSLIQDGALTGLSVGFVIPAGGCSSDRQGRTIAKADLREISIVDDPANAGARLTLKGLGDVIDALRSVGLSKGAAKKIAAGGWPALSGETLTEDDEEAAAIAALARQVEAASNSLKKLIVA